MLLYQKKKVKMEQQQIKQKYYRKEIFENDMSYPKDLIHISYSKHCLERL